MKIRMEIEVDFEPSEVMGLSKMGVQWFCEKIVMSENHEVILYSDYIGAEFGDTKIIKATPVIQSLINE